MDHIPKSQSWRIFDNISTRYDILNRLLSFGLDMHWRKCLCKFIKIGQKKNVLDLATGTADVPIMICRRRPDIEKVAGIDLAGKMLAIAVQKIRKNGFVHKIFLDQEDIKHLTEEDESFDNATIAFGIRNVDDPLQVLKETHRVLTPGGHSLILEFSMPEDKLIKFIHLLYLRICVPFIGWIFSGNYKAYKYLNKTIEQFPHGEAFCQLMSQAGFSQVKAYPLTLGVATIYLGIK